MLDITLDFKARFEKSLFLQLKKPAFFADEVVLTLVHKFLLYY